VFGLPTFRSVLTALAPAAEREVCPCRRWFVIAPWMKPEFSAGVALLFNDAPRPSPLRVSVTLCLIVWPFQIQRRGMAPPMLPPMSGLTRASPWDCPPAIPVLMSSHRVRFPPIKVCCRCADVF